MRRCSRDPSQAQSGRRRPDRGRDGLGTRAATVRPLGPADPGHVEALTELLAGSDDALLARYLGDDPVPYAELRAPARPSGPGAVPRTRCLFGSAITGAGTDLLTEALPDLLPAVLPATRAGRWPVRVFKIDRGPGGQKHGVRAAVLRHRSRPGSGWSSAPATRARSPASGCSRRAPTSRDDAVRAGQIAKLSGLAAVQIGDSWAPAARRAEPAFAPPTLETVVTPEDPAHRGALYAALSQLAEQDPLINLRLDPASGRVAVSLYGEVQKEVIAGHPGRRLRCSGTVHRDHGAVHRTAGRRRASAVESDRHRRPTRSWPRSGLRIEPDRRRLGGQLRGRRREAGHDAAGVLHRRRGDGATGRYSRAASAGR